MATLRLALGLVQLALHVLAGLLVCALVFPVVSATSRQTWIRGWSARLLKIFRVRLEIAGGNDGQAALQRSLVVANHVSWLDIFVINAMQPCRFVAKSDIRDWPLLGFLSVRAETIFISRGSARDVRKTFRSLVASIEAGERVAFFPEGTTAAQGALLPFHANLFEAAIDAGVPVQPLALHYLDPYGQPCASVDFVGTTTFAMSLLLILRGPPVLARIILVPVIASAGGNRRALALASRDSINAALGYAVPAGA